MGSVARLRGCGRSRQSMAISRANQLTATCKDSERREATAFESFQTASLSIYRRDCTENISQRPQTAAC
jgi:hypothetical protein